MSEFTIEGRVEVDDSSVANLRRIADEAFNLSAKLDEVGASAQASASGFSSLASPLDEVEQAQLANVAAAGQLQQAQQLLSSSQQNLNQVIVEYGANSEEAAVALRDMNEAQTTVNSMQGQLKSSVEATSFSMKGLVVSASGVATAAFNLYNSYDRIEKAGVQVDRANLGVKRSTETVEAAQKKYNDVLAKGGVDPAKVAAAQKGLEGAQLKLARANDTVNTTQEKLNAAYRKGDATGATQLARDLEINRSALALATKDVDATQVKLNDSQTAGAASSEEVKQAQDNLAIAQDALKVATERADLAQQQQTESIVSAVLQTTPALITMGSNVSTIYKNFDGLNGIGFSGLWAKLTTTSGLLVGIQGAAVNANSAVMTLTGGVMGVLGIVSSVAGPLGGQMAANAQQGKPLGTDIWENINPYTGKQSMGVGGVPLGGFRGEAEPVEPFNFFGLNQAAYNDYLARDYAYWMQNDPSQISKKFKSPPEGWEKYMPKGAKGAYVTESTAMVVGEAGPELIAPESKLREIVNEGNKSQVLNITIYPSITIGNVYEKVNLAEVQETINQGMGDALDKWMGQTLKRMS